MDPASIPQEARRRLLEEAWRRGLKPRDLGVSYSFMYQMRRGAKPVPDHVVARVLGFLDDDAVLRAAPELAPMLGIERVDALTLDRLIRLNIEFARRNPASAKVLLDTLEAEVKRLGLAGRTIRVTRDHLEEWRLFLEARVREGRLSPETARERDRYLRLALRDLGFLLGPQLVRQYVRRVALESPDKAAHIVKALRLFAKHVLGDRELYDNIPGVRPRHGEPQGPSWGEICRVIDAVGFPPARAYLYVLACTGMRPETVWGLQASQVRLDERLVWVWRDRGTKRDYFGFLTVGAAEYLRFYLEWRQLYLQRIGRSSERLFPVKHRRVYEEIYNAMDRVLGYRFEVRRIRHRVTTHLAQYLSAFDVNALTGHAPRAIVEQRYLIRDAREDLRRKYDEAMASVPCLGNG